MSDYRVVDTTCWERARHCAFFRESLQPMFGIGFDVDVTELRAFAKRRGLSFTLAFVHTVAKCASAIENFRYRFLSGDVVLYDKIDVSFTYLDADTKLFKAVNAEMTDDLAEFVRLARANAENQREYFAVPPNNAFFFTAIPWVSFNHFTHTIAGRKDGASPLFDWGKFYEKDGRLVMPFSVQAHHSFVDGYHIGLLAQSLQNALDAFGEII